MSAGDADREDGEGRIDPALADAVESAFDDVVLERLTDEHGFSAALHATLRASAGTTRTTTQESPRAPSPAATTTTPKPAATEADIDAKPALTPPARLYTPHEEATEVYPDVADLVTHFHFGDCEVTSSDGERIRLRQIKDGRVREVSLAMLKIEGPTTDPATNKRQFRLSRKN